MSYEDVDTLENLGFKSLGRKYFKKTKTEKTFDEDMKKLERAIIVLYNLYITNNLSIEDLNKPYTHTPHDVVVNLTNISKDIFLIVISGN